MEHPAARVYYIVFVLLLVLLGATVGVAELHLGPAGFLVAVLIASAKAALIVLFFMHVRYSTPLIWLVAGAGFFWLAILFGLTFSDYATRDRGLSEVSHLPGAKSRGTAGPVFQSPP
jgi:cytochrome c oxidase subunit 4